MMEIRGDIWKYHDSGNKIVITTNGIVKPDGNAIMGKGIALEAKKRFPELPTLVGEHITNHGNTVGWFAPYRIFTFPTKNNWRDDSSFTLIRTSAFSLLKAVNWLHYSKIFMVRPGCNNGNLKWEAVKPFLSEILDSRFIIVDRNP
jgi:hypothetical protein